MISVRLIAFLLFFSSSAFAQTRYGLELADDELRIESLDFLLTLYEEYCFGQPSDLAVQQAIESSTELRPAQGYEGTGETFNRGISFAVTANGESCTADVLLEYEPGKLLLDFQEVSDAVEARTGFEFASRETTSEIALDENEVLLLEVRYDPPPGGSGQVLVVYPVSNQANWYMQVDYYYPTQ